PLPLLPSLFSSRLFPTSSSAPPSLVSLSLPPALPTRSPYTTLFRSFPVDGINMLCETGLADHVLPEVPGMKLERDEHMQHKDVYWHSLTVLGQAIDREPDGPDLVLRWAALLHDIGKPATRAAKPGGGVTFHHHEVVGAKMVRKRMRALKYSRQMIED